MCFTPLISITTAIIEFGIVIYLLKRIKDKRLRIIPLFVLLLGLYQLTEFFLCTSDNYLWPRLGFIVYTLLPVLGMQLFYDLSNKKLNKIFYSIPLFYILVALLHPNFIILGTCSSFFITVRNLIFNQNKILMWIYLAHYFTYPLYGLYILIKDKKNLNKIKDNWKLRFALYLVPIAVVLTEIILIASILKNINYIWPWSIINIILIIIMLLIIFISTKYNSEKTFYNIMTLITLFMITTSMILFVIIPLVNYNFPSVYCQFAILYSLAAIFFVEAFQSHKSKPK
ncbi:hypothetical protein CMI38_04210 [Candidatus Pacearchaeota archaeon]|nr:hypothetical protein [Candidatus Pacearchaeota archaeon]|tara:strand:+ start:1963 stop:2817 length:855 start_codon:yes stop_codon:yes gene_type:complete